MNINLVRAIKNLYVSNILRTKFMLLNYIQRNVPLALGHSTEWYIGNLDFGGCCCAAGALPYDRQAMSQDLKSGLQLSNKYILKVLYDNYSL